MTPKLEALNAIDTARKMLASPEPLDGLRLATLKGTLDFAAESVEKIAELKRSRRKLTLSFGGT